MPLSGKNDLAIGQVYEWFCDGWYDHYDEDANRWAPATWYDLRARWAWHFCARIGY